MPFFCNICSDVLLVAKTEVGYKNLIKLSGLSFKKKVDNSGMPTKYYTTNRQRRNTKLYKQKGGRVFLC